MGLLYIVPKSYAYTRAFKSVTNWLTVSSLLPVSEHGSAHKNGLCFFEIFAKNRGCGSKWVLLLCRWSDRTKRPCSLKWEHGGGL